MTSGLVKRRMIKLHSECINGLPPKETKVTVPFSVPNELYPLQNMVWRYPYTDVHNSRVSYSQDHLNRHTIFAVLRLHMDSRVLSQQAEHIPQEGLSSSATAPSIDMSHKTPQRTFTSAEGVVLTPEYPSRSILWTTAWLGLLRLPLDSKVSSCSLHNQWLALMKVLRITQYKVW